MTQKKQIVKLLEELKEKGVNQSWEARIIAPRSAAYLTRVIYEEGDKLGINLTVQKGSSPNELLVRVRDTAIVHIEEQQRYDKLGQPIPMTAEEQREKDKAWAKEVVDQLEVKPLGEEELEELKKEEGSWFAKLD